MKRKENKQAKHRKVKFRHFFEYKHLGSSSISPHAKRFQFISYYFLAIVLSLFTLSTRIFLNSAFEKNVPFVLLLTPVLLSGWLGGLGPGLVATLLCTIGTLYFFFTPSTPHVMQNIIGFGAIIFLLEGALASILLEARVRSDRSLKARIHQQTVITQFGYYALTNQNLSTLFAKAAELVTKTLGVKYCKILEILPGKKTFLLRGGIGWRPGFVGHAIINGGVNSQAGYTLFTQKPVIVKDLKTETRFYSPELLLSHGVVSGISVIIPGKGGDFGILGVHSEKKRNFTEDDIYFVQAIANILATAIEKIIAETELRESQIRFKRLFDSNIIGAFISDFNGTFLEANDALLSLIEYTREDLQKGKVQRDMITPPEFHSLSDKAVKDLRTRGKSDLYEKEYITKSGRRVPVLIAVSRIDQKAETCVGFVLNISHQKELERRKDEFISNASHELKTPVTSLKILTQFLKQKLAEEKEYAKHLDKMDKQVNKLTDLISDLLDITKIQAGKLEMHKEVFNLGDLVTEIVDELQSVVTTHKIHVSIDLKDAVLADRERIGQVITNLLTNAIKYSPKGSEILLTVSPFEKEAIVSVQDFGVGIDKQYEETIFKQFFRIHTSNDPTYPGLGIGLYISSEIVRRHGGKIWVESQKGKGSTFLFALPLPDNIYEKVN